MNESPDWLKTGLKNEFSINERTHNNKGAIILTKEPQFQARIKHIQRKYHYVRDDLVATNQVEVKYIPTADMVADIFTQGLPPDKHWKFTKQLGLAPSSSGSVETK